MVLGNYVEYTLCDISQNNESSNNINHNISYTILYDWCHLFSGAPQLIIIKSLSDRLIRKGEDYVVTVK